MARNYHLRLLFVLFIFVNLIAAFLISISVTAHATQAISEPMDVQVDHTVQIRNGGLIAINDTIRLLADNGEHELDSFALGFPFIYRSNLIHVYAYDPSNQQLDVELDTGLGMLGFYGVKIRFPQSISLSSVEPYEFKVVYVLSDLISSEILPFSPEPGIELIEFNATFPAYPSLTQTASTVRFAIILPSSLEFSSSSFESEDIEFTNQTIGTFQILNYTKSNLAPFSYKPFWVSFGGTGEDLLVIETLEIRRDINIESPKRIVFSDSYEITTKAGSLTDFTLQLLPGAYDISAWDAYGFPFESENLKVEQGNATTPTYVTLTFALPLVQDESTKFQLNYQTPWENIIDQNDWQNYHVTLAPLDNFNWKIGKLVLTLTLPEGAELTQSPDSGLIQKSAFQETLTLTYFNVTAFQQISQEATYEYTIFWASFRPTLWVGTAVAILGVLALFWHAPRPAAPIPTILVKPEELKSYVDAYEQKRRNISELETLEERTRKRKIPRRRYKLRKKALESRLSVLSKDLTRLREKLQTATTKYADMMRQIEVAEAELEGIEAGIRRTETRYRRGEISIAAYHKLLEDYYRRRERAKTTIDGVLLRLREEIT